MKILQIYRQFFPSTGGIESVIYGLSKALQARGHQSDILTLQYIFSTQQTVEPSANFDGISVYRIPHIGTTRYSIAPSVLSFISHYDVIHIHAIDFFADVLALTRYFHRKPLIINTHGGFFHTKWFLPLKKIYFQTVTRLSLSQMDVVVSDSQHDYRLFQSIVSKRRLHLIENGVDIQPFLGIQKDITPGLLLGIGRIVENKGIEKLLELFPSLVDEFPHVHLVWIGVDRDHRIPQLMAQAQRLGIANRVKFVGQISDEQVQEWLSKAHVYVSASSYEAFGVSTIEAMSSGTVPVVTPVGIHPDVVKEGETGFLYTWDAGKPIACFRQVLSLNEEQLTQIGHNAQKIVLRYSWDEVVESYISIYRTVLSNHGLRTKSK